MALKTITVPAWLAEPFRLLAGFVKSKALALSQPVEANILVTSDWSLRVDKNRKSVEVAATLTATLPVSAELAEFLNAKSSWPVADGVALKLARPLMMLFNNGSIVDGEQLRLPEGVTAELDWLPDPQVKSIEIVSDGCLRVHLQSGVVRAHVDLVVGQGER